jgi:hypothetical protein
MHALFFTLAWSQTLGKLKWMAPVADVRSERIGTVAEIDDLVEYVYETMRNLCLRCYKKALRRLDWEYEHCPLCTALEKAAQTDWSLTYRVWLQQLPPDERSLVVEFVRNRFIIPDDVPPSSDKRRIKRALVVVGLAMAYNT